MSDVWIEGSDRVLNAVGGNQALADDILDGYKRVLSQIAPDGTIVYKELDSAGQIIGDWIP